MLGRLTASPDSGRYSELVKNQFSCENDCKQFQANSFLFAKYIVQLQSVWTLFLDPSVYSATVLRTV